MYDELVERLRAGEYTIEELSIILPQAADAIKTVSEYVNTEKHSETPMNTTAAEGGNMRSVFRKNCPLCSGKIIVSNLYQVSYDHVIKANGRISKKYRKSSPMSMGASIAACENAPDRCDAYWDCDSFAIDEKGRFIDFKYTEEET